MKSEDVVIQLRVKLPQLYDRFTSNFDVLSVVRASTVLTVTTKQVHNFETGDIVSLVGATAVIPITSISRVLTVATMVTTTDHDLTAAIATTIIISGATEAEFNGTFTVLSIVNRRTITFAVVDSGATSVTGSPVLEKAESPLRDYNLSYRVESVPDNRAFTVIHSATSLPNPIGTIIARGKPRISAVADMQRADDVYTAMKTDDWWMFAVLGDVTPSKDSNVTASGATADANKGNYLRQILQQTLSLAVFVPTKDEIAGRLARDLMEDLFPFICQCLLWSKFDSGLASGKQNTLMFSGHGLLGYDSAVYKHRFNFEQSADLGGRDAVAADLDVAFRDMTFSMVPDLGTEDVPMTATVDLDDTPLS